MFFAHITAGTTGVELGAAIGLAVAAVLSWERNRSIPWTLVASFFGWFYIIYFAITRESDEMPKS